MTPEDAERVLDLFAEARACAPGQRADFLARACNGNSVVRAEVESLLDGQAPPTTFLAQPAFERGLEVMGEAQATGELRAGDTLGDCRIHSLLGVGGMGEVYLADDLALGRQVALKLIQRGRGGTLLSHFRHERRVLAGLTHPNIARLYGGAITSEGRAYLVMEYVEGERLDCYCDNHRLGISERLALFRKVCAAVSYAHQNLVVHRDLKPANIRVTANGEPKLLDFGIAKLLDTETTSSQGEVTVTMSGAMTAEYASPEQLRGESITTASDVYSLGVVLYELLCGQRPYPLKSRRPDELARAICEVEPPRLSIAVGKVNPATFTSTVPTGEPKPRWEPAAKLRRRLEGDLDNIVAKALRKEPTRRYTSVATFSEDIRRHGEGLPVTARQDTLAYRAGKFLRRHKVSVAAAALVMLTLIGGLVIATWQARIARLERDHARIALASAQAARRQAELSREQANRLNDFLQKLLTSPSPQEMGKDVKVVEVLDRASKSVDQDLTRDPEVLAQIHRSLGTAYINLGVPALAEVQIRAALSLFQKLHGEDDAETVVTKHRLAYVLLMRKQPTEAEPLMRDVLRWQQRQSPPDPDALIKTMDRLSTIYQLTGRFAEAEATVEEMRRMSIKAHGKQSAAYIRMLNSLSAVKRAEGDYAATAEIARQAVEGCDQITRKAGIDVLAPELNLCMALFALGRRAEFLPALMRAQQDVRQVVGDNNTYSGGIMSLHAMDDFTQGKYQKAIPEVKQALEILAPMYPPSDAFIVTDRALLGLALTRTGQAVAGEPFLRAALADGLTTEKIYFPVTIGNMETALGECLFAQKRYLEAEPLLLNGYKMLQERPDSRAALAEAASRRLHDLYTAWNKPAEAAHFSSDGEHAASGYP